MEVQDDLNVRQLKEKLEEDFPQLIKLKSYFIAVNEEYAEDDQIIVNTDEIAIIPPVSGG
ncbi:MoaD/ThiS family protein [Chryseobacterium capnotolerans]|uniref:MoaD/ThiS family protein n=1 Tax=Chryseobacterium capnotolerans TaxID=2759528 RepID=UPI001E4AF384|nr:MoaD/ThiS family protein [Chryseobacterium capnotolerans]